MNSGALDLRRLDIFCRVVDHKSFSRAAEACHLSQPTVSDNIRLLEEAVEEKLLDRMGREVLPTPAGKLLYKYARQMLRTRDQAREALQAFRGKISGTLRLGASTVPGNYLLPQQLERFKDYYPDIQIELRIADSEQTLLSLLQGEIELALIGTQPRDRRLDCRPLFSDELLIAVPMDHPLAEVPRITPEQLLKERLIMREEGSGTRTETLQMLARKGIDLSQLQVVAHIGSSEAIRQSVKAGIGLAILSDLTIRDDIAHGTLSAVRLGTENVRREFYLVRRRHRNLSPLADAFDAHLTREPPRGV